MKPAPFDYRRPAAVDEALGLLAEYGDEAKVLAGGQSLLPLLAMRLAAPAVVVDIGGLAELAGISETAAGATRYGARVVHSDVEDGRIPDRSAGLLRSAAAGIGYRAIRNRGTLGGSLAHADPSAEWPLVLSALNATVIVRSVRGERTMPCRGFVHGYFTSALEDDELIVAVDVVPAGDGIRWGLAKSARKPGDFAESLAVAVAEVDGDGAVIDAELWLGAARDVPLRLAAAPAVLRGRRVDHSVAAAVAAAVSDEIRDGAGPEARYAVHLHGVTAGRAVAQLSGEPRP